MIIGKKLKEALENSKNKIALEMLSIANLDNANNPSKIDFIEFEKIDGFGNILVSWLPNQRNNTTNSIEDETKKIKSGKLGKQIKNILPGKNFSSSEIESFLLDLKGILIRKGYATNEISHDTENGDFERFFIVKGKKIYEYYSSEIYEKGEKIGTIGNSCLNDNPSEIFEIYEFNDVELLCLRSQFKPSKITARALLWKNCIINGVRNKTFLDRVYYTYQDDFFLYEKFAIKNGWYYSGKDNSQYIYSPDGQIFDKKAVSIKYKIQDISLNYYPFIDTLKYLYYDKSKNEHYASSLPPNFGNYLVCNRTDGYYQEEYADGVSIKIEEVKDIINENLSYKLIWYNFSYDEENDLYYFKFKIFLNYINKKGEKNSRDVYFLWISKTFDIYEIHKLNDFAGYKKPKGTPDILLSDIDQKLVAESLLEKVKKNIYYSNK